MLEGAGVVGGSREMMASNMWDERADVTTNWDKFAAEQRRVPQSQQRKARQRRVPQSQQRKARQMRVLVALVVVVTDPVALVALVVVVSDPVALVALVALVGLVSDHLQKFYLVPIVALVADPLQKLDLPHSCNFSQYVLILHTFCIFSSLVQVHYPRHLTLF
jgi:hypothetical protein